MVTARIEEKVMAQRVAHLMTADGRRLDVVAKLSSLGGQVPHFSVTSQHGANHDEILAAAPEMAPLVRMHLCSQRGVPMHAKENLSYFLKRDDYGAASALVRGVVPVEDLMVLRGQATMAGHETKGRSIVALQQELAALEEKEKRTNEWRTTGGGKPKAFLSKADGERLAVLRKYGVEKHALAHEDSAFNAVVGRFVDERLAPKWREMADEAMALLDGGEIRAENYRDRDADPSTYRGFLLSRGITMTAEPKGTGSERSAGGPSWNFFAWECVFSNRDGERMTVPFRTGTGLVDRGGRPEVPTADHVLSCIASDARSGSMPFEDFCAELGCDADSRSAERIHEACERQREDLESFLGAEDLEYLLDHVSEEGEPVLSGDQEEASPSMGV